MTLYLSLIHIYPEPMVLPRAADDQATAQALSSVLPVVLEQADYEQVYRDVYKRQHSIS